MQGLQSYWLRLEYNKFKQDNQFVGIDASRMKYLSQLA